MRNLGGYSLSAHVDEMNKFIATPRDPIDQYPWRPMSNREKRARWSLLYYAQYRPGQHPMPPRKDRDRT